MKNIVSKHLRYVHFIILLIVAAFYACNGQTQKLPFGESPQSTKRLGDTVTKLGKNIDCIFQDKDNNYWFASNGEGVYRYDGKTIQHITDQHGLCSNFVWTIQEDVNGNLWFTTRDGVCRYNGTSFTNYTDTINNASFGELRLKPGGLFFNHLNGVCYYDGKSFTKFNISPAGYTPPTHTNYRPYAVYCALVDTSGNVWFGTQEKGVARYDGKAFTYLTEKNLAGPAVRTVFEDKSGVLWFGNNGGGLFRYNEKSLRNITEENNLGNAEFLKGKPVDKPGSMARVFAINEDNSGALWIGTVDAGVWKYDGTTLTNYTTKDGLTGNSVATIYKDKKGELWFVSNGDAILKFNGQSFTKVNF